MESIRGSLYVEIEFVLGLFLGHAAPATSAATTTDFYNCYQPTSNNTGRNDKSDRSSSKPPPCKEEEENEFMPLPQRELSSHSPFDIGPTKTLVFAEASAHSSSVKDLRGASDSTTITANLTDLRQQQGGSMPAVDTLTYPLPVVEAPYPPSLIVQFGEKTRLIDVHSPSVTAAAAAGGFGVLTPLLSSSPGFFLISPTECTTVVKHTYTTTNNNSVAYLTNPLPPSPPLLHQRGSSGAEVPPHPANLLTSSAGAAANNVIDASRVSCAGSSHASLPFASHPHTVTWEAVLDIVEDTGSELDDSNSNQQSPQCAFSPPRSFCVNSASSVKGNDEASRGAGTGGRQRKNNKSNAHNTDDVASLRVSVKPLQGSGRHHSARLLSQASPMYAPPTCQAAPLRQVSLSWLAEHVRNDSSALSAINWTGSRLYPLTDVTSTHSANPDATVRVGAFAAAWYAHMFPENEGSERNMLSCGAQPLQMGMRGLRSVSRKMTAAIFPLSQRFSFLKVTIEVKSRTAFDLHDAMRKEALKKKDSRTDSGDVASNSSGTDAECLVLRIATPVELKKARKAPHRTSTSVLKKSKAVEDFFVRVRRYFTHCETKKTVNVENNFGSDTELQCHESFSTPSISLPRHQQQKQQQQEQSPAYHIQHTLRPASCSGGTHTAHANESITSTDVRTSSGLKKGSSKTSDAFAVHLHLSRLLSPTILEWAKRHRRATQSGKEKESCSENNNANGASRRNSKKGSGGTREHRESERPAVFCKSVYLPLPPPSDMGGGPCVAMMVKVNVVFKPGFETAEPF